VLLLVSLTEERAIYLALELDRSWTEMPGVNPLDGTNYLDTASAFLTTFPYLLGVCPSTFATIMRNVRIWDLRKGHLTAEFRP
jgi:hypothetical protein